MLSCLLALAGPAQARDWSIAAPDSTEAADWDSLSAALRSAAVQGGDRLVLQGGFYGALELRRKTYDPPLEITSAPGARAHVSALAVIASQGLILSNFDVWPRDHAEKPGTLVSVRDGSADIVLRGLDIRANAEAPETYMSWSKQDWVDTWRLNGVRLRGERLSLLDSRITATGFGVTAMGDDALIAGNHIEGFSGDAMRALGDGSVLRGNRAENCFRVNRNHDDGFQSWATKTDDAGEKVVQDIVFEGNVILEWTGPKDHPLRCALQGVGLFDGNYRNFTIQNNVISVSAYHGIALYGGQDSRILNNTVVHPEEPAAKRPWILVSDDNTGEVSERNIVANNAAMAFQRRTAAPQQMDRRNNTVITYPARYFVDPAGRDYHLKADSGLIDGGIGALAPARDAEGVVRPYGAGPDLGAYEWHPDTAAGAKGPAALRRGE